MATYYPPSPHSSMHGHQPVMYNGSHQSYGNGYLAPQPQYANSYGALVIVAPSSGSRHHVSSICIECLISSLTQYNQHGSHRSHRRGHSRPRPRHHHHHHRTLGERILGWFGIRRHRSHHRSPKGWSFFGSNRHRTKYMDARSGLEVDRQGRRVYKV